MAWMHHSLFACWASRLLPVWGYYIESCYKHWCVCFWVNINVHISGTNTKIAISESYGLYVLSFLRNVKCFAERLCHFTFPPAMDEWSGFSRQYLVVSLCVVLVILTGAYDISLWFWFAWPSWLTMLSIFSLFATGLSFPVKCFFKFFAHVLSGLSRELC